ADDDDGLLGLAAAAEKGERALRSVVAVDPLEAGRLAVARVQGGLGAVGGVQVADPALQAAVRLALEERPVEARLVVPLAPLAELAAHEEELLAGLRPLAAEQRAQGRAADPSVP